MLWPPLGDVKNKGGEQDRTTQNGGVKNFGQNPQERQIILKKVILDTFWKNMSQKKSTPLPAGQNKSWSPHTVGQKTCPPLYGSDRYYVRGTVIVPGRRLNYNLQRVEKTAPLVDFELEKQKALKPP